MVSKLAEAAAKTDTEPNPTSWVTANRTLIESRFLDMAAGERFMRSVSSVVASIPALARCTPESVLGCVTLAADLKLDPNPIMNEFHFSVRDDQSDDGARNLVVVPIIGYQGYAKLAYNTGRVEKVETFFVREGDDWDTWGDSDKGRQFTWRPQDDDNDAKWTRVVALVKIIGAGTVWTSLTRKQVEARRPPYSIFWQEHYDAMARKTAIRELAPLMPKSVDMATAIVNDEQHVEKLDGVYDVVRQP